MQGQQLLDHHKFQFEEFPPRPPTPSKEQLEQQERYLYWLDRLADPTTPLLYDYPNIQHRPMKASLIPPQLPSTTSTKIRVSNRLASRVPPLPRPSNPDTGVSLKRPVRSPVSPVPPPPKRTRPVTTKTVVKEEDKSSWTCKYCGRELKTQPDHYTYSIKRHLLYSPTLHPDIPIDTIYKDYGSVLGMTRDQVRTFVKNRKR